jgi:hypothetical protein
MRDQEIIDHLIVALEKGMQIDKLENLFASRYKIAGEDFIRLLQVATRIARHDNMGALPICMPKEEMEGILRAYLDGREYKYRADAKATKDRSSEEHAAEADRLEALAKVEKNADVKKRIEERAAFHREEVGMDSKRGDQGIYEMKMDMASCKVGDHVIVGGSWNDTPGVVEECSGNRVKVKPVKGEAEWVPIINCKKRADDDCDEVVPSRADAATIQSMMYGDQMRQHALDKMIDGMSELKSRADKIFDRAERTDAKQEMWFDDPRDIYKLGKSYQLPTDLGKLGTVMDKKPGKALFRWHEKDNRMF